MVSRDYEWFIRTDTSKYKGKYVIIRDQRVVYGGDNLKEMINKFKRKYPNETPIITKVPKDEVLVLVILRK